MFVHRFISLNQHLAVHSVWTVGREETRKMETEEEQLVADRTAICSPSLFVFFPQLLPLHPV